MASSKNPNNYGFALWELVRAFHQGETQPLVLPFNSHRDAEGFRFNYYGFKNALKAEQNELAATASALLVKLIRVSGSEQCNLEFSLRDDQDANLRLEEILRARQAARSKSAPSTPLNPTPVSEPSHDDVLNDFLRK